MPASWSERRGKGCAVGSEVAAVGSVGAARVSWPAKQTHPGEEQGFFAQPHVWLAVDSGRLFCVFLWLVCADVVLFHPYEVQ